MIARSIHSLNFWSDYKLHDVFEQFLGADVKASRMPRDKCDLKWKHIERWATWWRSAWTVFFAAPYLSRKVEAIIKRVMKERLEKQNYDDAKCNRLRLSSQIQGMEREYYSNSICRWLPFICRFAWSFEMLRRLEKMRHSARSHVDLIVMTSARQWACDCDCDVVGSHTILRLFGASKERDLQCCRSLCDDKRRCTACTKRKPSKSIVAIDPSIEVWKLASLTACEASNAIKECLA